MSKSYWRIDVTHDTGDVTETNSLGITIASPAEIKSLAEESGCAIEGWEQGGLAHWEIRVNCEEESPALRRLVDIIAKRYNFYPAQGTALFDRNKGTYNLVKYRKYSEQDLNSCELLYLYFAAKRIGWQQDGTPSQANDETYVMERRRRNKVSFGTLVPFHALAISGSLKTKLEQEAIAGLQTEPVVNGVDIWKLSSSVRMPRSVLPLIRSNGEEVKDVDEWISDFDERCYADEYSPFELIYERSDVELRGVFDIAVTAERTGVIKERSYRWCVVSQRFREVMKRLKVSGMQYAPVHLR